MASRMPVVVSDVPSNLEWVKAGYNGEIFPRGDEATLASKILMLAADPVRSQEYGDRNLAIVRERGDWGRSYRELERIYSQLIKKGKVQ
jgi:glycosyltransferase involved in cell wall biosynthesis